MSKRLGERPVVPVLVLLGLLGMVGCGSDSSSMGKQTATPTFSPGGGTYSSSKTVTIADSTPGAVLYCTTDGTAPSSTSPKCGQPTTVYQTEFLQAIAVAPGYSASTVASAAYSINLNAAATPTFSPAGGSYSGTQQVTIADATAGANLFYTLDGSVPTASSTLYTAPIAVAKTETITAIAVASGYSNSGVASAAYTIGPAGGGGGQTVPAPSFSPAGGASLAVGQMVTIADTDGSAVIYYTLDGSQPTSGSTKYAGSVAVTKAGSVTVNAIAIDGSNSSSVASATYTVTAAAEPAPSFSPASGASVTSGETVTITDTDGSAAIYYTLDGSQPSSGSTKYTSPVALTQTPSETVNAIAVNGGSTSSVATATYTVTASGTSSVAGTVMSGTQPVKGAQVQLYAAGVSQSGYGAGSSTLGASVTTDATGAFTVSYNCPAAPGDLVYVVATGGDAGSGTNSALGLMAALGSCSKLDSKTVYTVNEATTVAAAYALSPFMTAAPAVGSSSTNYQGISNAFATVDNLVDPVKGAALSITPAYVAKPVTLLNSSTAPQARVDTLANALNACAGGDGSGSSGCSALFKAATPSGGTAPTDTLQAILNIAQNPGANAASVFSAASASGPFQPVLTAAPGDWTLALTYTGGGLGLAADVSGTVTVNGNTLAGIAGPVVNSTMAIDAAGNIWVGGYSSNSTTSGAFGEPLLGGVLAEFNSQGAPLSPVTTASTDSTPNITYGGYNPEPALTSANFNLLAFDLAGNLWLTDGQAANLFALSTTTPPPSVLLESMRVGMSSAMAIDGSGDVWLGGGGGLFVFNNSGTSLFSSPGGSIGNYASPTFITFDSNGNPWIADAMTLYEADQSTGDITYAPYPLNGPYTYTLATPVADNNGYIYSCIPSTGNPELGIFNTDAQRKGMQTGKFTITTGRACGDLLVLDGNGHLFAVSPTTIDEFTTSGTVLSPAAGFTGTSSGEPPTLILDSNNFFFTVPGIGAAIDGSGNLWVLNNDTGGTDANSNPISGNVLVEFVGIAAPVLTPASVAVSQGQPGTRP